MSRRLPPQVLKPGFLLRARFVAAARARLIFLLACAVMVTLTPAGRAADAAPAGEAADSGAAALRPLPLSWRDGPVRAAWIVRDALETEADAREAIRAVAAAGMRVAFVQVVGRADAYYTSDYLPRSESIRDGPDYDPLAVVLDEASKCGVEVHAWVNVLFAWSGTHTPKSHEHIIVKHPDWTVAGPDLKSYARLSHKTILRRGAEGVYLSPAQPGVHEHVRRYIREILEHYPVAGVHLDYVRYPTPDAGYDRIEREGFAEKTGVDPLEMVRDQRRLTLKLGPAGFERLRESWREYRADQVTSLVREIAADVREVRPDAMVTAAVRPNPDDAAEFYGQDWTLWLKDGLLDAAVPMCYVPKTGEFAVLLRKLHDRVDPGRLLAGVSVYNQGAAAAAEKIRAADACGMLGTSLFSWNSIADDKGYVETVTVAMASPADSAMDPARSGGVTVSEAAQDSAGSDSEAASPAGDKGSAP